jgi:mannosyl-3-phosphoglycerate phosphatase
MRKTPIVTFVDIDSIPAPPLDARAGLAALLERLAHERITIIFCTDRTRAEIESTRQAFGIFHPFVCEGGSAVFVPERYFGAEIGTPRRAGGYEAIEFGLPYDAVVALLKRASQRVGVPIAGFNDMSVEQVARELRLSLLEARLAKLREYVEPFKVVPSNSVAERRLVRALESAGLTCRPAGEFHHVGSVNGPQAAMAALSTRYQLAFGGVVTASAGAGALPPALAAHVDVAIQGRPVDGDPSAPVRWLESLVGELTWLRDSRAVARTAQSGR